jgi:hypothetical protein
MTEPFTSFADTGGQTLDISHAEFCKGLPAGHFRLIVNPQKARKYVRHRLFLIALTLPVVGFGAAFALSGSPWLGLSMIVAGVGLNRLITYQAPKILLYLATQDARTYREAIEFEIMEVRSAR